MTTYTWRDHIPEEVQTRDMSWLPKSLPTRAKHCLSFYTDCRSPEDVRSISDSDLLGIQHCGRKTLKAIRSAFAPTPPFDGMDAV